MRKFLAVLKREYWKIVWTKLFIITTLLLPFGMVLINLIPMYLLSIKGNAVRLVVVEQDGKIFNRLNESLSTEKQLEKLKDKTEDSLKQINTQQDEKLKKSAEQIGGNFAFELLKPDGKSIEQIKDELNRRISEKNLDGYLIIPPSVEKDDAKFEFYARNSSDFISRND